MDRCTIYTNTPGVFNSPRQAVAEFLRANREEGEFAEVVYFWVGGDIYVWAKEGE